MADSIRKLLVGLQSTRGAAPSTWIPVPFREGTFNATYKRDREEDKVETGYLVKTTTMLAGANEDSIKFGTHLYYSDPIPTLLTSVLNSFVSTAHGSIAGVKDHTTREAPNRPLLGIRHYDGARWWQALDQQGSEFDLTQTNKKSPTCDFTYMGASIQPLTRVDITSPSGSGAVLVCNVQGGALVSVDVISGGSGFPASGVTGTVVGIGTGATVTVTTGSGGITGVPVSAGGSGYTPVWTDTQLYPAEWGHYQAIVAGAANLDVISSKLTVKTNLEGLHTGRRNADPVRYMEGDTVVGWEIMPDFKGNGGLLDEFLNNVETFPYSNVTFDYVNTKRNIGSGSAFTNPSCNFIVNRALKKTGDVDQKPKSPRLSLKGTGALALANGCALTANFTNTDTSYVGTGS